MKLHFIRFIAFHISRSLANEMKRKGLAGSARLARRIGRRNGRQRMSTPGVALIGFMTEPFAVSYLAQRCVPGDPAPAALSARWQEAKARRGGPTPNAGRPEILPIPPRHAGHLQEVAALPRFAETFGPAGWGFRLIEIDRLIATQFEVELPRAEQLCVGLRGAPTEDDLVRICLPKQLEAIPFDTHPQPQALLIRSRSLNLEVLASGLVAQDQSRGLYLAGAAFGPSLPLVQVGRFQERCYLIDGYHRAFALRQAGATHLPCVFVEVTDYSRLGARGGYESFEREVLESADPPTFAHFATERAYPVTLRELRRVIHVTWSQYIVPTN
jgi:hypothetical protein